MGERLHGGQLCAGEGLGGQCSAGSCEKHQHPFLPLYQQPVPGQHTLAAVPNSHLQQLPEVEILPWLPHGHFIWVLRTAKDTRWCWMSPSGVKLMLYMDWKKKNVSTYGALFRLISNYALGSGFETSSVVLSKGNFAVVIWVPCQSVVGFSIWHY